MKPRYVIAFGEYGETSEFDSLEDAERTLHACGDEWAGIRLCETARGLIVNERDEVVGYVSES